MMDDNPKRKPGSLLKRALFNQYNYIMMGSAGVFSLATGSWPYSMWTGSSTRSMESVRIKGVHWVKGL